MNNEFAYSLAAIRLLQTAHLLEWMVDNSPPHLEDQVRSALDAVRDARDTVHRLRTAIC